MNDARPIQKRQRNYLHTSKLLTAEFYRQKLLSWKIKRCLSIYKKKFPLRKSEFRKILPKIDPKNH